MTLAEAQAALERDPANISAETATTLRQHLGEDGAHRAVFNARSSVRVKTSSAVTFDYVNHNGSGWRSVRGADRQPEPAPAPAGQPYRQPGRVDPEVELATNPVNISAASRQLLIARYGEAEYRRRWRDALHTSGQINMKVTPK